MLGEIRFKHTFKQFPSYHRLFKKLLFLPLTVQTSEHTFLLHSSQASLQKLASITVTRVVRSHVHGKGCGGSLCPGPSVLQFFCILFLPLSMTICMGNLQLCAFQDSSVYIPILTCLVECFIPQNNLLFMSFLLFKTGYFLNDAITKAVVKRQVFSVVTFLGAYLLTRQDFYFDLQLRANSLQPTSVVLMG